MAMGPERSKPLHNFSLPHLRWGNQRFLRCVKVAGGVEPSPLDRRSSSRFRPKFGQPRPKQIDPSPASKPLATQNPVRHSKRKSNDAQIEIESNNIDAVREKLMIDLRVAAKKLKVSIFEEGGAGAEEDDADADGGNARPWNLRTRRSSAACKAPTREEETNKFDSGSSPVKVGEAAAVARENPGSVEKKKTNERAKFSVSLSKEEVEQDFLGLVGTKPPRRPKKRPRIVQRQLDTLFPGLWLTEVTAESYKVPDVPE